MSLQVGKSLEADGHLSFGKRLLSRYNPAFTLDKYVDYFQLKELTAEIKALQQKKTKLVKKVEAEAGGGGSSTTCDLPKMTKECDEFQIQIDAQCEKFFELVKTSFFKVKHILTTKERECAGQIDTLKTESEDEVRKLGSGILPIVYRRVKNISLFRELNLLAFRKILTKFNEQVATLSLPLQEKVRAADRIINDSTISKPFFDVDYMLHEITTIYAVIEKIPFEDADKQLLLFLERDRSLQPRISPMLDCFYFTRSSSHRQFQGDYALKVVPALTCRSLGKMLTSVINCTLTTTDSALFANGEVSVRVGEAVRGDDVFVVQSLRAFETDTNKFKRAAKTGTKGSMSTAIVELMLTIQTLALSSAARITAVIPFLSYGDSPMAVAALAEMLMVSGCRQVVTVDLQRDQMEGMFGNRMPIHNVNPTKEFIHYLTRRFAAEEQDVSNLVVVSPDGDNVARARQFADALMQHINEELFGINKNVKGGTAASTTVHRSNNLIDMFRGASSVHLPNPTAGSPAAAVAPRSISSMTGEGGEPSALSATFDFGSMDEDGVARTLRQVTNESSNPSTPVAATTTGAAVTMGHPFMSSGGSLAAASGNTPTTPSPTGSPPSVIVPRASLTLGSPRSSAVAAAVAATVNVPRVFVPVATALKQVKKDATRVDLVGDVNGKTCIVVDTKVDEGVSALSISKKLKESGAAKVIIVASHGLFSGDAVSRLQDNAIDEIIVTDTIDNYHIMRNPLMAVKLRIVSVAPLLARIIQALHSDNSLSKLVDGC